jgi:hypothetical protein
MPSPTYPIQFNLDPRRAPYQARFNQTRLLEPFSISLSTFRVFDQKGYGFFLERDKALFIYLKTACLFAPRLQTDEMKNHAVAAFASRQLAVFSLSIFGAMPMGRWCIYGSELLLPLSIPGLEWAVGQSSSAQFLCQGG